MLPKRKIIFSLTIVLLFFSSNLKADWLSDSFKRAETQTRFMLSQMKDSIRIPRSLSASNAVEYVPVNDWTSGFFSGTLWMLYRESGNPFWLEKAKQFTSKLYAVQYITSHHDIGFMLMTSYGQGYSLIQDSVYKNVIIEGAKSLVTRFCDKAGTIQSWEPRISRTGVTWDCPVIIDNMMNLELLFRATQFTGDSTYARIAIQHANNTLKNHVRDDFSTYHVVNYDVKTGLVTDRDTWQGYARNSTWARGQAWAIYGFTICYKETGNPEYLKAACELADFYLNNKKLPADKIPYWDFNAGENGYVSDAKYTAEHPGKTIRDASAAAIVSSALFDISEISADLRTKYFKAAELMVKNLSSNAYMAKAGTNGGFLLKHSVGNMPRGLEIDVPLNYADYYYMEALIKYQKILNKN